MEKGKRDGGALTVQIELFDVAAIAIILAARLDPINADVASNYSDPSPRKNVEHCARFDAWSTIALDDDEVGRTWSAHGSIFQLPKRQGGRMCVPA